MYNNNMKKIFLSLFVVFFSLLFSVGGGVLLSGCNSSTQQEQTGDNGESGSGDENISADANINFMVAVLSRTSSTAYTTTSSSSVGRFSIYWHDENGTAVTWGNSPTYTAASGYGVTGGTGSSTYASGISRFNYSWTSGTPRRYARIYCYTSNSNYTLCGVSTSTSNSSCQSAYSNGQAFYIYGNGQVTTSATTALNNCTSTLTGNFYIHYRYEVTLDFDINDYTYATRSGYAGLTFTLPDQPPPSDDFYGWASSPTSSSPLYSKTSTSGVFSSAYSTVYAIWSNTAVTFDANGGYFSSTYYQMTTYGNSSSSIIAEICDRTFWKNNSGTAYAGYLYRTSDGYVGPLLVSRSQSSVSYLSEHENTVLPSSGSITYNGVTWYYSSDGHWFFGHYLNQATYNTGQRFRYWVSGTSLANCARNFLDSFEWSGTSPIGIKYATKTVPYGASFSTLPTPTRSGYIFDGWYTSTSYTTEVTTSTINYYRYDRTLYAKWIKNATIRYSSCAGTTTNITLSTTQGTLGTSTLSPGSITTLRLDPGEVATVTATRASSSYSYYIGSTSSLTTSSSLNSFTFTIDADVSTSTYYVYLRQRITLQFYGNGNTSGTNPTTRYTPYGTSYTMPSASGLGFSRTGYTFENWNVLENGSGVSYAAGSSYTMSMTYITMGVLQLYAQWDINTYVFSVYYSAYYSSGNQPTLSVIGSGITVSTITTPSSGGTTTVFTISSTYSTTAKTITFNSSGNRLYITGGTLPSTTYGPSANSLSCTWTPNRSVTCNLEVRRGYPIIYSANNGSGTVPAAQTAYHGVAITVASTSGLSRSGYNANGWSTTPSYTTSPIAAGSSTTFTNQTNLYVNWAPANTALSFYIMTETGKGTNSYTNATNGNSAIFTYKYFNTSAGQEMSGQLNLSGAVNYGSATSIQNRSVTISPTAGNNFMYAGVRGSSSTLSNPTPTGSISTSVSYGTNLVYYIYVFFKQVSQNVLKYDSEGQYFYFESGYFPQSYVGNSLNTTLRSQTRTTHTFANQEYYQVSYNGTMYIGLVSPSTRTLMLSGTQYDFTAGQIYFFEVEPIKWRVSDYGVSSTQYPSDWDTVGALVKNFNGVSEVLWYGSLATSLDALGPGDTAADLTPMNDLYTTGNNIFNIFRNGNAASSSSSDPTWAMAANANDIDMTRYVTVGSVERVESFTEDYADAMGKSVRISSIEEISDLFSSKKMRASDLVCFMLGIHSTQFASYWTRDLGSTLGNGTMVGASGISNTSVGMDNYSGMCFTVTFTEGSRA